MMFPLTNGVDCVLPVSSVQPQQRKFLEDTQRRLNVLFDGLNCETIPEPVVAQLGEMVKGESIGPVAVL